MCAREKHEGVCVIARTCARADPEHLERLVRASAGAGFARSGYLERNPVYLERDGQKVSCGTLLGGVELVLEIDVALCVPARFVFGGLHFLAGGLQ